MNINSATHVKSSMQEKKVSATKKEEIKDKVEIGTSPKDEAGFIHKTFRGLAKLAGGSAGTLAGATTGTIHGAAVEKPNPDFTAGETKILRTAGALTGLVLGTIAGLAGGPAGVIAGLIAGPIVGSTVFGAVPGMIDGAYASIKGGIKGSIKGAKKGAELGGKAVDKTVHYGEKVVNWFKTNSAHTESNSSIKKE
jgi:hypothetical protein